MSQVVDSRTGIAMGDPAQSLIAGDAPGVEEVSRLAKAMILSASGWRAVFAADGDEESHTTSTTPVHLVIAAIAAQTLCQEISREFGEGPSPGNSRIAVGLDTRPTGPAIAHAAIRSILSLGWQVDYPFICASPEIMAYVRSNDDTVGFVYVSASHNPVGHNGLKLGRRDGSVAGGDFSKRLISDFLRRTTDAQEVQSAVQALSNTGGSRESDVFLSATERKTAALTSYNDFCTRVIGGESSAGRNAFNRLLAETRRVSPGVVVDFNGSARATSIDLAYLKEAGCVTMALHERPGDIAHQIVPEGAGLNECRIALSGAGAKDGRFQLGYVPDNDGDRGNIVYRTHSGDVSSLEAQEVFALACVAELAWIEHLQDEQSERVAVVVNGPTSMRIDRIASLFGAEVHRAEVGEANVVNRARDLRRDGYLVRILGEGSNGGNITHPSTVRDPMHTVFALLKLLYSPRFQRPAPVEIWAAKIGGNATELKSIEDLVGSLPKFTTTSAYEPRAIMHVATEDHARLKSVFESLLDKEWPDRLAALPDSLGIETCRIVNYEGTLVREGPGNRTGAQRGGLKVELVDASGIARAYLWMRGSGTEPVFRILVDVEGDIPEVEAEMLGWLRSMVQRADVTSIA